MEIQIEIKNNYYYCEICFPCYCCLYKFHTYIIIFAEQNGNNNIYVTSYLSYIIIAIIRFIINNTISLFTIQFKFLFHHRLEE